MEVVGRATSGHCADLDRMSGLRVPAEMEAFGQLHSSSIATPLTIFHSSRACKSPVGSGKARFDQG
jgi:hypothetical protein